MSIGVDNDSAIYHRPPGGESWVDVALRLRSLAIRSVGNTAAGGCCWSLMRW